MADDAHEQTRRWIRALSAIERPSASAGERRAAEWIAARLPGARVEVERAHGTHLPFVLPSAVALVAGVVRSRRLAALATAAIVDEVGGHRRLVRRALARRETCNVVADRGDPHAARTIVFVSHHDAARPWNAAFGALVSGPRRLPIARTLVYAPLTVLLGARRTGMALCALVVALFADIARRPPVPGANDNASGVAAVLGVAADLDGAPGVRVVLLSTGSEETMLEGMEAFLRRHRHALDPSRTLVVCLDMLGWDRLIVRASEGVLRRHPSRAEDLELVRRAARAAGVDVTVAPPGPSPTDGLAARWAGLPTVTLTSVAATGGYPHYHRPTDVPAHVAVDTVVAARRLGTALVAASRGDASDTLARCPTPPI